MLLYYAKRFDSAQVGARIVSIQCDKCGCEYFYELARIGVGTASAPYGAGQDAAARKSQETSQRDLDARLSYEAELVPCPKCGWINEDLIRGYRLGRLRQVGTWAIGIAIVGSASSLIAAWFTSTGGARDRELLPYFLYAGPAAFIAIGVLLLLFRAIARRRIQPNADFPLAPRVPPGTPPALVFDAETGEFRVAAPSQQVTTLIDEWREFQLGRDALPYVCCGCLKSVEPGCEHRHTVTNAITLEIPRCAECAGSTRRKFWLVWSVVAAVALAAEGAVLFAMHLESPEFWIVLVTCASILFLLAAWAAAVMTAPVKVRIVDSSRGVLRLKFRNREYLTNIPIRRSFTGEEPIN
jgi:hypothetical protein